MLLNIFNFFKPIFKKNEGVACKVCCVKLRMATFSHTDILNMPTATAQFIKSLNMALPCKLSTLVARAHMLCPELKEFCADGLGLSGRDKGSVGKLVEYYIFGRLPNNDSSADTAFGDCKATHVKKLGDGFNAKERLTLTNCGSTGDYSTLQHIVDAEVLAENRCYSKIQTGILTVLEHSDAVGGPMDKTVLCLFRYDITELPATLREVVATDYEKIRTCVKDKAVSQAGQTYLHIHPHGAGHGSTTRAFGFTNKFVTQLIAFYTGWPLFETGRSLYFKSLPLVLQ